MYIHTQRLRLVLQFSEVEMKFLLAHFIVVPLIIFIVSPSKRMTVDGASSFNDCGDITGGWKRVAYIDAKDKNCSKLNLTYIRLQVCSDITCPNVSLCIRSRKQNEKNGCVSLIFPTRVHYTKVCGRARGYQFGFTRAFHSYEYANQRTLDDSYVSGLSVTHGKPGNREHIWTFAAGFSQAYGYATVNCPCALYPGPAAPNETGNNYFCDSGNRNNRRGKWYLKDNYLWDSEGCETRIESDCCRDHKPWFKTEVGKGEAVKDDIEVRMCHWPPYTKIEDIGVEELAIFIN